MSRLARALVLGAMLAATTLTAAALALLGVLAAMIARHTRGRVRVRQAA
jgi:hypothetical protein